MIRQRISRALFVAVVLGALVASADGKRGESLSDFKKARDAKGCASIPYKSQRTECKDRQHELDTHCKEKGAAWNCDEAGKDGKMLDPTPLKKKIVQLTTQVVKLKATRDKKYLEKSNIKDKKDEPRRATLQAELEELDEQISTLEGMVAIAENELLTKKGFVDDRRSKAKLCSSLREQVVKTFDDAKGYAEEEDDKDIAPIAKELVALYVESREGHRTAIESFKTAEAKCQDLLTKF